MYAHLNNIKESESINDDVLYTGDPKDYMYKIRKLRQIINEKNVVIESLTRELISMKRNLKYNTLYPKTS